MSGSSIGAIVGGIIGILLTPFTGGYSLLVTSALMSAGRLVGGLLDPPSPQQFTGPRLADLGQQTATYGAFIPRVYGKIAIMGNVFWIENNKLKEVATTQSQGGKGGPPEVNSTTYKYYGTFAVGLCEGLDPALYGPGAELVLSKLWVGEKLFYNRSSTDEETVLTSIDRETKFKFYSGTETQLPEPRMEADLGIANTPAYRGLAYLVIYDMDVQAYGNTIAGVQIKAEILTNGIITAPSNLLNSIVYNTSTGVREIELYKDYVYASGYNLAGGLIGQNGFMDIYQREGENLTLKATKSLNYPGNCINHLDYLFMITDQVSAGDHLSVYSLIDDPVNPSLIAHVNLPHKGVIGLCVQGDYLFIFAGVTRTLLVYYINNPAAPTLVSSSLDLGTGTDSAASLQNSAVQDNYYYYWKNNTLYIIDITDKSNPILLTTYVPGFSFLAGVVKNNYIYMTSGSFILKIIDVSNKLSPSVVLTIDNVLGNWSSSKPGIHLNGNKLHIIGQPSGYRIYDITNPISPQIIEDITLSFSSAFVVTSSDYYSYIGASILTSGVVKLASYSFIPQITQSDLELSDIVSAECRKSNLLDASHLDVSLLTQTVRGYRISSVGSIRGGVEPLQAAWPFDVVQDGYKIKYVPRGGSNVATITYDKLDARGDGAAPGIQISNSREMESQLPAKVSIKYMDINRAYNTGEQYYERINTDAVNHADLEMPIVFNAQEAAGKAQTLAYLYWLERYDISFKLPPEYLQLQPSDVITITTPDASYNLRLKQINYTQDGRLECQAKYNHAALYSPSATGEEGVPPDDTLSPPGTTTYELLDIPCLLDIYNVSGFPVAMTGAKKGWPGGVLARSDDGGASYTTVGAVPSPGTVMGLATNTIGAHDGLLLDKASVLNVKLTKGGLSSVSELQLFNGANHFAYGIDGRWEIIAAQLCVLQGDGSYNLSDFMRGRFGTEIYTGTHAVNDNVIYLVSASMLFQTLNSSAIGLTRHYKGVNFQSTLDTVSARAFIYNGVNLECLSPVYLNGNRHPTTNDWTLDWIRRGRINNEWKDLIDVPVGETSEAYEIDIYSSSGFTTVLRTLSGLTSATATYTSAQQVTDFGSNQATIHVKVYQLSSTVGRGYPLTQSITR